MRPINVITLSALIVLLAGGIPAASPTADQGKPYTTEFVRLRRATTGLLYLPTVQGPEWKVGLVSMHPNNDWYEHPSCTELAARGFRALCVNGQYVNQSRDAMIWENLALDVAPAVRYMRQLPGIEAVVLVGHSGGGQLMPFYQNVAENGVGACQRPELLTQCPDSLADLPSADGVVLLDAHSGHNMLTALDPAVTDENHPERRDPSLDLFSPANGYNPNGPSIYGEEFKRRFYRAQAERMNRLIARALERRAAVRAGESPFTDTEPFLIARTGGRMWELDTSQISHTTSAYPVLKPDGSQVVEVPHTVRVPTLNPDRNDTYVDGAGTHLLDAFLSMATRTTDDYYVTEDSHDGVLWDSSNSLTPGNITGMHVPVLIMAMTGHYWMVVGETLYQRSGSADKTLVFVEGATHNFTPCRPCERTPGEFGDTVKTTFDYAADWIRGRFVAG